MNSLIKVDVTAAVIGLDPKAEQGIAELLSVAEPIQSVANQEELAMAVHAMKQLREHPIYGLQAIEQARKTVKAPVLELGKRIDELAKECASKIEPELDRVNRLANAFTIQEQARIADLERQRQAEIAAIEHAHREADRAAQLALSQLTSPDASIGEAEDAMAARQAADDMNKSLQDHLRQKPIVMDKPIGLVVKNVLRFEVTDSAALYAVRPDFFDLVEKRRIIADNITPSTNLPGLKIWQETVTETR